MREFDDFDLCESCEGFIDEFEYVDEDWYYYDAFIDDDYTPY
jgi:hypothetical protein